jgi:hypothetical protein
MEMSGSEIDILIRFSLCQQGCTLTPQKFATPSSSRQHRDFEMEQTTARLRKTFQYPADNDDDDSQPEALDEEGLSFPSRVYNLT